MTHFSIADLAVLGIASERPIEPKRIAAIAKALVPELWQPTASVIDMAIQKHLTERRLRRTGNRIMDEHLVVTAKGIEKICALLLCRPERLAPSATLAAEAVQFCFLDTADAATASKVLQRFQAKLKERLVAFERRSAQCPYAGRYSNYWIGLEQQRLAAMVQFVATICDDMPPPPTERRGISEAKR